MAAGTGYFLLNKQDKIQNLKPILYQLTVYENFFSKKPNHSYKQFYA